MLLYIIFCSLAIPIPYSLFVSKVDKKVNALSDEQFIKNKHFYNLTALFLYILIPLFYVAGCIFLGFVIFGELDLGSALVFCAYSFPVLLIIISLGIINRVLSKK